MDSRQPLKDVLGRIVEDMNILVKQLVAIMCVPRDSRSASTRESDVTKFIELFKLKEQELIEGMQIAAQQTERQKIIDQLQEEVKKRDECITKISTCFKNTEDVLINAIYQANQKLKSIGEANRKKVSPDDLIKYAHKISSTNAVAAPLTWQQGDPQRPYPTELEMWQGWPERIKERSKMEKDFSMMPMGMIGGQSSNVAAASGALAPSYPPPGSMTPQQHEFFMRPQAGSAMFAPPSQIPSSPMTACRPPPGAMAAGWMSPRAGGQQVSPRVAGARPLTPGSAAGGANRSPYAATVAAQQKLHPATPGSVPNSVEVMSSDSSSSSDSDSQ